MNKDIAYYMARSYNFIAEYVPESNNRSGYYFGLIEELPGCHAFGASFVEMLKSIEYVKKVYFESRLKNSEYIPEPGDISLRHPPSIRIQISGDGIDTTDE
ncbi:type II toxin-antitoxin system HicB family antitoxin [Cohnella nanjingensis]|uniref:Type II toxin-antitoxin system HicB family antitoxin n=1 Tax=Cohnella nanjingensis TaxID=1387779 RepID=A0A7X0RPJ8_9BACL|nr:type II toxin-antitoxin system HicB family antitoxin [Cohnella nanjingensis]MBB6671312.1 type II toxin-antitoxin system HicB family antitoxin [Cohnella nanjingensis]